MFVPNFLTYATGKTIAPNATLPRAKWYSRTNPLAGTIRIVDAEWSGVPIRLVGFMLKRHEDALMSRFDAVANLGWAHIEDWEMYLWYEADRIGKRTWRDLQRRFHEDNEGDLYIYKTKQGLLLIHNDGLTTIAKKLGENGGED